MKKIALILSILLIVGLNVEAQRREARSSAPKSYKKSESAKKKSTKNAKPVAKINTRKSVNSKSNRISQSAKKSNSRSVATRADRNNSRAVSTRSNRSTDARAVSARTNNRSNSRSVASRPDRRVTVGNRQISGRIGNANSAVRIDNRSVSAKRRPLSIMKTPRISNVRVRHGYIDYSSRRHGYFAHSIMSFPMRVRYPFYHDYHLVLMHRYQPQIEYPWAIYESENGENTASIEGKVIDVDYNRRTNQFVIHFGRKSPYQSATVIIPDYLAQYIDYRTLKKIKRDYVSVYGVFTEYGNVPTIMISSLEEFFVDEVSLKEFLYYN